MEGVITQPIQHKMQKLEQLQLKILLKQRLQALEASFREMESLQIILRDFAQQYFSAVGIYASRLAQLSMEPTAMFDATGEIQDDLLDAAKYWLDKDEREERAKQLKQTYRKLAQKFHPDHNPNQTADDIRIMQEINAAYAAEDMGTLLRFEIEYMHGSTEDTNIIAEKLARCEALIGACIMEREALENSPIFELHSRHMLARLAGEDFITQVINRMKSQLKQQLSNRMAMQVEAAA